MEMKVQITGEVTAIENNPNLELTYLTIVREMPSGTPRTFDVAIAAKEVTCEVGDFVTAETGAFIHSPELRTDELVINVQYVARALTTHTKETVR